MKIVRPQKVFFDTCHLINLASERCKKSAARIRRLADKGEYIVVVTEDVMEELANYFDDHRAYRDSILVDSLHPCWMLRGRWIYHREAYSEFLRLMGREPLPKPALYRTRAKTYVELFRDCSCDPKWQVFADIDAREINGPNVSGAVRSGYEADRLGLGPNRNRRIAAKDDFKDNRSWARAKELTPPQLELHYRKQWCKFLSEPEVLYERRTLGWRLYCRRRQECPLWQSTNGMQRNSSYRRLG